MLLTNIDTEAFDVLLDNSFEKIKPFKFKPNNDLGNSVQNIASLISPILTDNNEFKTGLNRICNNIDNYAVFKEMDDVAINLAANMGEVSDIIRNKIISKTTTLCQDITDEKNRILQAEGIDDFIENKPDLKKHYNVLSFINPRLISTDKKGLIEQTHALLNIKGKDLSITAIKYATNDIKFSGQDVDISEEDTNKFSEDMNGIICDEDDVCNCSRAYMKYFTDKYAVNQLQNEFILDWNNPKVGNISIKLNRLLPKLIKLSTELKKNSFDISKTSMSNLLSNINGIDKYILCSMYYLQLCQEVYLKDTLIINDKTLNEHNLKEFEKLGFNYEDIYKHIKLMYDINNNPIPNDGIKLNTIVDIHEKINTSYLVWRNKQKEQSKTHIINATKKAYNRVMRKYINEFNVNNIPKDTTLSSFINSKIVSIENSSNNLNSVNNNIVDSVIDMISECEYSETIVPKTIKLMRKELVKLADNITEIKPEHVDIALAATMADIIIDVMKDKFIE
jgi:hypothetical protein